MKYPTNSELNALMGVNRMVNLRRVTDYCLNLGLPIRECYAIAEKKVLENPSADAEIFAKNYTYYQP